MSDQDNQDNEINETNEANEIIATDSGDGDYIVGDTQFDKVNDADLKKTMETSYINYAMSVIVARALPDVRDGLKPVQRRILHAMRELNNGPDKPHRKCARIVGDTMGKYHPHGDSSIYGALVNLAQDWTTRYPLVDGHGNFGSMDGDSAAAMRYTEARLSKMSMEMLSDIDKDTVDFIPNFDETETEPTVLPSRFPNLLVNGTTGIAVGMATNIPPHNLREVVAAVTRMIDDHIEGIETTVEDLLSIVKGPDFPTGATILGMSGIREAYRTGRGKIYTRAVTDIEEMDSGKLRIVVTELPYSVNKAKLIEKMAELVHDKRIDGITALRDESNRQGMRICIELRRDVNAKVLLNQLYAHTQLQETFGANMLALVNGQPRVLNLLEMLKYYIKHQKDVVTRRTKYDLRKAQERAHILEGLLRALDVIDEIIRIIRGSKNGPEAKERLIEAFDFDDLQASAIVEMRLRALTGLERERLLNEYQSLKADIERYEAILGSETLLLGVIREEINAIATKYGDDRRTAISMDEADILDEDLIPDESTVIAMTHLGYIKRMSIDNFRSQNRGGKGIKGMQTIEEDFIEDLFMTTTHHFVMFFTNCGRAYRLKAYEIPESSRTTRGTAIINLLQLQPEEHITAVITLKEYKDDRFLMLATKFGTVKKTRVRAFANIRKTGLQAINLREGDELIEVKTSNNERDVLLVTKKGRCIRFSEKDIRSSGRTSMGVRGMRLGADDEVVSMQLHTQGKYLLFVTEFGYGIRTDMKEFEVQREESADGATNDKPSVTKRGGQGKKAYKISDKTGNVIGAKAVEDNNEIIIITNVGIIIRIAVEDIRPSHRGTSGVKLMNIDHTGDVRVATFAKVREDDKPAEEVLAALEETLSEENVAVAEEDDAIEEGVDADVLDESEDDVAEESDDAEDIGDIDVDDVEANEEESE